MFEALKGLTLSYVSPAKAGDDEILFKTTCGKHFRMYHQHQCSEEVSVEEIIGGDMKDLLHEKILLAEEVVADRVDDGLLGYTWTFYKLSTNSTSITIRWCGSSNGYYSESVDFEETFHHIEEDDEQDNESRMYHKELPAAPFTKEELNEEIAKVQEYMIRLLLQRKEFET